ncbi:hypothetical protein BST61_g4252 [Cercospora zeina]
MIGAVGVDDYATRIKDTLRRTGIDVSGLRTVEGQSTGTCFCIVEEKHEHDENPTRENRLLYHLGAAGAFCKDGFKSAKSLGESPKPDLLLAQLELKIEVVEQLLNMAHEADIEILLNAAPANDLLSSDKFCLLTHLLVNEIEAASFSGREVGEARIMLTRLLPAMYRPFEVEVVDPTGAGDAFTGAYATEYCARRSWALLLLSTLKRLCIELVRLALWSSAQSVRRRNLKDNIKSGGVQMPWIGL